MLRFVAFDAVFFLLPFAAYAAWLLATRRGLNSATSWPARTIAYLAVVGAVVMFAAVVVFTSFEGAPPGSVYKPATIGENGEIIPGHFE